MELGFLVSIGQDENNQLVGNIDSWRWYENSDTVRHYEHGWRSMNTRVSGQEILPGFILDVGMIEEAISQVCYIYYWSSFLDLIIYLFIS